MFISMFWNLLLTNYEHVNVLTEQLYTAI